MENKLKIAKKRVLDRLSELIESNERIIEVQEKLIESYDALIELRKKQIQNLTYVGVSSRFGRELEKRGWYHQSL